MQSDAKPRILKNIVWVRGVWLERLRGNNRGASNRVPKRSRGTMTRSTLVDGRGIVESFHCWPCI